jgi:hypothetical protein
VFGRGERGEVTAVHTDLGGQPLTLERQPAMRISSTGSAAALATVGALAALEVVRRRRR